MLGQAAEKTDSHYASNWCGGGDRRHHASFLYHNATTSIRLIKL
jgi:hypothetical protein